MDKQQLTHSLIDGHLGSLQFETMSTKSAKYMLVQALLWIFLEVELLGHKVGITLIS